MLRSANLAAAILVAAMLAGVLSVVPAMALDADKVGLSSGALSSGALSTGAPPAGGSAAPVTSPAEPSPQRYGARENHDAIAVVVGNRAYGHGLPEVRYAENDAEAVRRFLVDRLGYRPGNVIDLRNASQAEMLSVFGSDADHRGKLWAWIRPGLSDLFVYYSGHGVPGLRDRRGYLLPVDADPATPEINGYSLDLMLSNLTKLNARSTIVMIDACFSGSSAAGWLIRSASPVYVRAAAPPDPGGMTIVTAARGDQVASWDDAARLGLFTRHMLDALAGGAADRGRGGNGDGAVSLSELEAYLDDEMTYAARRLFRRVQQASILGDPASVLVERLPADTASPAWREPAAPVPVPLRGGVATPAMAVSGIRRPMTVDEAEAFLAANWEEVRTVIFSFYAREGSVWDLRGNPPIVEFAERMRSIDRHEVVQVAENRVDLAISYRWSGGSIEATAAATVRLRLDGNGVAVERMWR